MQKMKRALRTAVLYVSAVVLLGGAPMVAFADQPPETYTYNATTKHWDSNKWIYDAATNTYVPAPTPTPTPTPSPSSTPDPSTSTSDSGTTPSATADQQQAAAADGTTTPAGGNATVNDSTNGTSNSTTNNGSTINNTQNANSVTGSAGVTGNTKAGDASSGTADANTTIVNSVHSTVGGDTSGVAHFTTNINGDVTGDITIAPSIANAEVDKSTNLNSNTNVNNNDSLTNNVNLNSNSGDATVSGNTQAGSATSGNANTVANVLNLINTVIAANKSFVGTINIYGNLNGDILISPEFIPQLLAANNQTTSNITLPLSTNINDDQSVVNNVKLNATTGSADVSDNTGAGSATTGTADTNLTILNLTGHAVNAKNSLLVFVNVLGKWVGMIVDAPGSTAAALGNGVTNDTVNVGDSTNVNNSSKITNNLDLTSQSGNASVTGNTSAGNATSGDATASANIGNISTSEFNLSDWFGVLYINVFGSWIGSFGVDTAAGTVVPMTGSAVDDPAGTIGAPNLHFGFSQKTTPQAQAASLALGTADGSNNGDAAGAAAMLVSAVKQPTTPTTTNLIPVASPHNDPFSVVMMAGGFSIVGASAIWWALRRWMEYRSATITM